MPVLTQAVRDEELTLLLLFPNGDRRFVPVAWTDAVPPGCLDPPPRRDECLAPLAALLRARAIVDALLQRLSAAEETPDANLSPAAPAATDTALPEHARPGRGNLGDARPRHQERRPGSSGAHPGKHRAAARCTGDPR